MEWQSVRVPKHINVYGKRWTVSYKWNLQNSNGERADGLCDTATRIIWIDRLVEKPARKSVFLHELLHAILFELKIGQTSLNCEVEEIIVTGIEEYLIENFNMRLKNAKARR